MRILLILTYIFIGIAISKDVGPSETQRRYERKAILSAEPLIKIDKTITVKAVICPKGSILCIPVGNWNFKPDRELKRNIRDTLIKWIVTQRFDKILFEENKVVLITARDKLEKQTNIKYKPPVVDEEKFINENFAPIVNELLKESIEIRYRELPYKEQELFINTKAKELGIPADIIESLMQSSFLFTFDIKEISINFVFHRKKVKKGNKKFDLYTTSVIAKSRVSMRIYKFDPEKSKYIFYKKFKGTGTVSHTETFPFLPATLFHVENIVKNLIVMSIKASALNLGIKLKYDDNFAIFAIVENSKGFKVNARVGTLEDLRIDAPYTVLRHINGKKKEIALIKVRKVADNCESPAESSFSVIKGTAEKGDMIREIPWSGIFLDVGYKKTELEIKPDGVWEGYISTNSLFFGIKSDLGFIANSPSLSEVWMAINIAFEFGNIYIYNSDINEQFKGSFGVSSDLILGKRLYLINTGLYVEPSIGLLFASYGLETKNGGEMNISYFSFKGSIEAGFTVSHNFEIFAGISIPILQKADINIDIPFLYYSPPSPQKINTHSQIHAGVRFSIPATGFFSKIFAKSKGCK